MQTEMVLGMYVKGQRVDVINVVQRHVYTGIIIIVSGCKEVYIRIAEW